VAGHAPGFEVGGLIRATFSAGDDVRRPRLAREVEENAGETNSSLVRLETNAVFGVERQTARVRIAA